MKMMLPALALMTTLTAAYAFVSESPNQNENGEVIEAIYLAKQDISNVFKLNSNTYKVKLSDGNTLHVEVLAVQNDRYETYVDMGDVQLCNQSCNYGFVVEQGLMGNVHNAIAMDIAGDKQ